MLIDTEKIIIVGDRVLIRPHEGGKRSQGGLYLPPNVIEKEKVQSGYVLKVGPGYPIASPTDEDEPWKEGDKATLRLPSGEMRMVRKECYATIGQVGNLDHENIVWGKAGKTRWMGRRPKVRGVAMNPVDHPLGGGEGKSSGGRHPVTPWGKSTKGYKTRKKNKLSDKMIVRRRQKKK